MSKGREATVTKTKGRNQKAKKASPPTTRPIMYDLCSEARTHRILLSFSSPSLFSSEIWLSNLTPTGQVSSNSLAVIGRDGLDRNATDKSVHEGRSRKRHSDSMNRRRLCGLSYMLTPRKQQCAAAQIKLVTVLEWIRLGRSTTMTTAAFSGNKRILALQQ